MIKQRLLLILICCFFAASGAIAQRGQVKGMKSNMTEETKTALNLSAEQRAQIDALQAETATSLEAVRQQDGDKGAAMREVKQADQAKLEGILTSEQLLRLRNIRTEAKGDRSVEGEERTRVRPEQAERTNERVRPAQKEDENVRPEQVERTRERVRPTQEEERTRVRPAQKEGERVRPEQAERSRERVRPENGDRRSDMSAEDRQRLQTEINNYRESNVEPAMQAQRQKLETAMSAEDRAHLTVLRRQLSTDRELRNAHQNKEVVAMVSRYDGQITSLLVELEPRQAQWKADQNIIRAKYMGQSNDRTRRSESEMEDRSRGTSTPDMEEKVRFLLRSTNEGRR